MARNFLNVSAGPDYIQGTAALFSYPFTINAWLYPNSINGVNLYATLHNVADNQRYSIGFNNPLGRLRAVFQCFDTTLASSNSTGSDVVTGTWNMVTGLGTSATNRLVYLNGTAGIANTTSKTPTTPTRWVLGGGYGGGAITPSAEGKIAEFAVWNVALTADEITSLSRGTKAKYIRPQNLKVYVPLISDVYDERELTTSTTTTGTTVIEHCRRYG